MWQDGWEVLRPGLQTPLCLQLTPSPRGEEGMNNSWLLPLALGLSAKI